MVDHSHLVGRGNMLILLAIETGMPVSTDKIQVKWYTASVVFVDYWLRYCELGLDVIDQLLIAEFADIHLGEFILQCCGPQKTA